MRNPRRVAAARVPAIWLVACSIVVSGCSGKTTASDGTTDASAGSVATGGGGGEPTGATAGSAPIISAGGASISLAGSTGSGESTAFGGASGNTAAAGGAGGFIELPPLCPALLTTFGNPPTKGGACGPTDPQLCYKTCGPQSIGYKSETCSSGVYVEGPCQFAPGGDFSCYAIPPTIDPACPALPPQAGTECDVPACTPCSAGGTYLDSAGTPKIGYCVCVPGIVQKWSCAPVTSWPCPGGTGC
jgi:hypothetical protein